jgi:hypothetical protein
MRVRLPITMLAYVVLGLSASKGVAGASSDELVTTNVKQAGIAIDVPNGWTGSKLDPKQLAAQIKGLKRTDPDLAKFLRQVAHSGVLDHSRLIAYDPSDGDTLNVLVVPQDNGETIEDLKALADDPHWAAAGFSLMEVTATQVGTHPAVRFVHTAKPKAFDAGGYEMDLWMQMPKHRDVNVSLVVDDTPQNRALVDRILSSIRTL